MTDTNAQTLAAYDQAAENYIAQSPQTVAGDLKAWIDVCLSGFEPSAKILEIGTGSGKDADYIEAQGFAVERTDASKAFVALQRQKGHTANQLNAITETIVGSYDLIFANAVLLHFNPTETSQVIRKVYNALLPGGRFAFTLKQGDGEAITDQKLNAPRYFCYWHLPAIEHVLARTGFSRIVASVMADYRDNRPAWLCLTAEKGLLS